MSVNVLTGAGDSAEPKNQSQAEGALAAPPLTIDYRPNWGGNAAFSSSDPGLGRFGDHWQHLRDVEAMVPHPDVVIPYSIYKSGISEVSFEPKAKRTEWAETAQKILTRLWESHLDQMQLSYDFGWCGYELEYRVSKGYVRFEAIHDLHPLDCWALTVRGGYRGFRLKGTMGSFVAPSGTRAGAVDLWGPGRWPAKGLWLTHNRRWDRYYGRSQLAGAWRPWRRLACRDGAEEVVDGAFYRGFYQGPEIRYPADDYKKKNGGETDFESARNDAMRMAEQAKAGFSSALPNTRDAQGEYKWQVKFPDRVMDLSPGLTYEESLQKQIARGVGTPPELFEASDTGSGYSGRKIPLMGFYVGQRKNARNFVKAALLQIVNPILRWNHGDDARAECGVDVKMPDAVAGEKESAPTGGALPPGAPPPGGDPTQGPPGAGGDGPPQDEGGGGMGGLEQLLPGGGGAMMSLAGGEGEGAVFFDPGWYPEDDPDLWSRPVEGWQMAAPADASQYQQREITRGPRRGQTAWYNARAKKFMPADWSPRQGGQKQEKQPAAKAPEAPAAAKPPRQPAKEPKAAAPKTPAQAKQPASPPAPQPAPPQGRASQVAAKVPQDKVAAYNRVASAANKEAADPSGPMARLKDQFVEADFGAGKVRTVRSTKDSPLSQSDHEAMDRMHSRAAAALKMAGEDGSSAAQMAAAQYHRAAAAKRPAGAQGQAAPPQQPAGQQPPAAPQPTGAPSPEAAPHLSLIARSLNHPSAAGVPAEAKRQYMAAAKAVIGRMTPEMLKRYGEGVGGRPPRFYQSPEAITEGLMKKYEAAGFKEAAEKFRGQRIAGMYEPFPKSGGGQMHLDGQSKGSAGAFGSAGGAEETYAHEFAHAIDGPKLELSSSDEWKAAYESELKGGGLTNYARQDGQEAFAEFGRLLLSGKHDPAAVKAAFPMCHAFWAGRGLVADAQADASKPRPRLAEHFGEKLKVGGDGTHADGAMKKPAGSLADALGGMGRQLSFTLSAIPDAPRDPDAVLDAVSAPARALCREAREALLAELGRVPREMAPSAVRRWADAWTPRLAEAFGLAGLAGTLEGMRSLAGLLESGGGEGTNDQHPWALEEAAGELPLVAEAVQALASRGVIGLDGFLSAKASAEASGQAAAHAQAGLVAERVRSALSRSLQDGTTLEDFRRDLKGSLGGTALDPASTESVFRTNVMAAYSDGQERLLAEPEVGSLFPYRAYHATRDDRVRPEHLAMEAAGIGGTNLYRADDPVWQLYRPPSGFNCRCGFTPVTVSEAARRGVDEARKWQETGAEPQVKAWVEMPAWRPEAAVVAGRGAELSLAADPETDSSVADLVMRLVENKE